MAANLQGKFFEESYFWVFLFHPENGHREYSELEARCEGRVIPYLHIQTTDLPRGRTTSKLDWR